MNGVAARYLAHGVIFASTLVWFAGFSLGLAEDLPLPANSAAESSRAGGIKDNAFGQIPFDTWRERGNHGAIPWDVQITSPLLSSHQRLEVTIKIGLKIGDRPRHGANGDLLALVEFQDQRGVRWQTHSPVNAASWEQRAFLVPGPYTWSAAIWNPANGEYSFTRRTLSVPALKADPLPDSWNDLPEVEFVSAAAGSPDEWFLPEIAGRLRLPVRSREPIHLEVLLNTTPTSRPRESVATQNRNLSVLIPAVKVLSQIDLESGAVDVSLLDLTHRRMSFEQQNVRTLNWAAMRAVFASANPGVVDVGTLKSEGETKSRFENEVRLAMRSVQPKKLNIVIVLSGPAAKDDPDPLPFADLPDGRDRHLYFIRYGSIPPKEPNPRKRPRPARPPDLPLRPVFRIAEPFGELERRDERPDPRVYDLQSAEQFRRALAGIMMQISTL